MSALEIARKALAELAQHIDCGCVPCTGQCWSKDALREELADRAEEARKALAAIDAADATAIRCDEPDDVFSRATRDIARSA